MQGKNCGELIKHIHCAMQKDANNELRAEDLTFAQVHLLFTLQRQPDGTCPLKGLEKKMGVAQSTTAGLVKRSAEKGFVELLDDPRSRAVFQRRFGKLMKHPMVSASRSLTLAQLMEMAAVWLPQKTIQETWKELKSI